MRRLADLTEELERVGVGKRASLAVQRDGSERMFGIQSWIALPQAHEETDPSFQHFDAAALPTVESGGAKVPLFLLARPRNTAELRPNLTPTLVKSRNGGGLADVYTMLASTSIRRCRSIN